MDFLFGVSFPTYSTLIVPL